MQKQEVGGEKQTKGVRNAMILVFLCGTLNIVIACMEFVAFLPERHVTNAFVDAIIDLGLSIVLLLMVLLIHKKNRWGWAGVIGVLGFLMINQIAIAPTLLSSGSTNVWFVLLILWAVVQGVFMVCLQFSKRIRYEISTGYLLQPPSNR